MSILHYALILLALVLPGQRHVCELPDCDPDPVYTYSIPSGYELAFVLVDLSNGDHFKLMPDKCRYEMGIYNWCNTLDGPKVTVRRSLNLLGNKIVRLEFVMLPPNPNPNER